MNEYLSSDNRVKPNFVVLKNITISFTTSYGSKSILISYKEEEENSNGNLRKEEDANDSTPSAKKQRTYVAAVVMQKTTFLGLRSIVKCVDARLKQLEYLSDNVNKCALYLIQEIELKLSACFINQEFLKLTLRDNCEDTERNVRTQINFS